MNPRLLSHLVCILLLSCSASSVPLESEFEEVRGYELSASDSTITITCVGDVMLGTWYPLDTFLHPNPAELLRPALTDILSADISFLNLEGTLLDTRGEVKKCGNPSICYAFKSPQSYGSILATTGFDIASMANNHSGDFGLAGRDSTKNTLSRNGIKYCGLLTDPVTILKVKGLNFGFVSFSPNTGTLDINDTPRAKEIVDSLSKHCDVTFVSFHGGGEGNGRTHITKKHEHFVGEDRGDPYHFARAVINAGADVVCGQGPHVPRAFDSYKGKIVMYSLGNFVTWKRFNLKGPSGLSPLVQLTLDRRGNWQSAKVHSFKQYDDGGLTEDPNGEVFNFMQTLTTQDIPQAPLTFSKEGYVYPR